MPEIVSSAASIYKELGILAFLVISFVCCAIVALGFLIWRISKTQDRITLLLDKLFASSDAICQTLAVHDRQAQTAVGDLKDLMKNITDVKSTVESILVAVQMKNSNGHD